MGNLKKLRTLIDVRLVQLMGCYDNDLATGNCLYIAKDPDSAPWDFIATGDARLYSDMMTPAGLAVAVSRYMRTASGVTYERYSAVAGAKFTDFTTVATPAFCAPK